MHSHKFLSSVNPEYEIQIEVWAAMTHTYPTLIKYGFTVSSRLCGKRKWSKGGADHLATAKQIQQAKEELWQKLKP